MLAMTGTAVAAPVQISFNGLCDGMAINVVKQIFAAAKPTGCLQGASLAVGAIGKSNVASIPGKWLVIGRSRTKDIALPLTYIIQYPLKNNGVWFNIYSPDGVKVLVNKAGRYSLGLPAATRARAPGSVSSEDRDNVLRLLPEALRD